MVGERNGRSVLMNVLFIHQSAEMYGSDRVLLNVASELRTSGSFYPIVVLPTEGPLAVELRLANVECFVRPVGKISRSTATIRGALRLLVDSARAVLAIRRIIKDRRITIVHSNTIAVLGGALAAYWTRTPHVWHVHELIARPRIVSVALARMVGALADRVICISRMNAQWLVEMNPSIARKVEIVWNGIRRAEPMTPEAATRYRESVLHTDRAGVVITCVGRFNRWKGQEVLIDAIEVLWRQGERRMRVLLVGSAPPDEPERLRELRQKTASMECAQCIALHPFTADIWPVWEASDIVVVPSTEPEPFGLVAVEAMAAGKPVVGTAHGGLLDIIENGETGILVRPSDAESMAAALQRLIDDESLRRSMGKAGQRRQERLFSLPQQVEAIKSCYGKMIA